jgi:hypothetical protein
MMERLLANIEAKADANLRETRAAIRTNQERMEATIKANNLPNPSGRTMALGSTQPVTEISTRNLKKETWG